MANDDISRFLFQPAKHYTGARMQQGRVILDSDFNENEQLDDDDIRRDLLNVIGTPGTPQEDPGFAVTNVHTASGGRLDFLIGAGAIYIGGLRFRLEQEQQFLKQTDFLQLAREDLVGLAPTGTEDKRFVVVVEGFEQTVTSVEDTELRERALGAGGPDTSTRVRRTVRVHAVDVTFASPQNCATGFDAFKFTLPVSGTINADSEFEHAAKMTVDFTGATTTEDLCNPAVEGGYLGAENQAIRIMGVTTTSIVWGFENASPLYRVQTSDGQIVTMLDRPRDQAAEPLTGQIVEILPASAVLPNGEIVAGLTGQLARVIRGFDPDDGTMVLAPGAIDLTKFVHGTDFTGFPLYPGAGIPTTEAPFFLRVWNQGSASLSATDSPEVPIAFDTFVALGATGLKVKFDALVTPGAFWVIASRPESRQEVIPRSLKTGEPPMGPRRFYAPIAFIKWKAGEAPVATDCRTPFPPLTAVRGCCNFRVGDGQTSFGDFNNVQQALDALPIDGGQLCLLPGTHQGAVVISGRRNIKISGCGKRSVLIGDGPSAFHGTGPEPDPVMLICDSEDIRLESFAVLATGRAGIHVQNSTSTPIRITFLDLDVTAEGINGDASTLVMPVNAIHANNVDQLVMSGCRIQKSFLQSFYPAVFLIASNSRIVDNDIGVTGINLGWHGLQLGSGSVSVEVRRNRIAGGFGHGITLGHVSYRPVTGGSIPFPEPIIPIGLALGGGSLNFSDLQLVPKTLELDLDSSGTTELHEPFSSGGVFNVAIVDNLILTSFLSGISVAGFFLDLQTIFAQGIEIRGNTIRENGLGLHAISFPVAHTFIVGMGGIALGMVLNGTISDNVIVDQGQQETAPIAGIVVLLATDLTISDNRIENNGRVLGLTPSLGWRGGIVIVLAVRLNGETLEESTDLENIELELEGRVIRRSLPTVRIVNNTVVQPEGKSVHVNAFGPVHIESNYLENHGDRTGQIILGLSILVPSALNILLGVLAGSIASSIQIFDFGVPLDIFEASFFSDAIGTPDTTPVAFVQNGTVRLHDNQIILDWVKTPPGFLVFATVIITLDHLSYQDNHVTLNMHNRLELNVVPPALVTSQALANLIFAPDHSMAVASAFLIGLGVTMSGNRMVEGRTDAVLSAIAVSIPFPLPYPVIVTSNISTHCIAAAAVGSFENNHVTFVQDCEDGLGGGFDIELPPGGPIVVE